MLKGIDVSSHQSAATLATWLPKSDFCFVKATEGMTYDDPSYRAHKAAVLAAGKLFGAYHFSRPENNAGTDEAGHFHRVAGLTAGQVPVLDFEPYHPGGGYTCDPKTWPTWAAGFVLKARALFGVTPWIYTNRDIGEQLIDLATTSQRELLLSCPLWFADYTGGADVPPGTWDRWTVHQWAESPIDQNLFAGDRADWLRLAIPGKESPMSTSPWPDTKNRWDKLAAIGFPRSTAGLRQFQAAYHFTRDAFLKVDGVMGPASMGALDFSYSRLQAGEGTISRNFSATEFQCTCGGVLPGCKKTVVTWKLLHALERYRDRVGGPVRIVSPYRCEARNRQIPGSATNSRHIVGDAVDIPGVLTVNQVKGLKLFTGIGFGQISGKVTHLDVRPGNPANPSIWPYKDW